MTTIEAAVENPLITAEWCWVTDAADPTRPLPPRPTVHRSSCTQIRANTILRRVAATDLPVITRRCENCS